MDGESFEEAVEGLAAEVPVEGLGGRVVAVLEGEEPFGEGVEVGKVAGLDHLALDDGEEDLNLVQPAGVDGQVDQFGGRPGRSDPVDGAGAVVRGAVVRDPETPVAPRRRARLSSPARS